MTARRKERIDRPVKAQTDTIYALASTKNIMYLLGPRLIPALLLLIVPAFLPTLYMKRIICLACVYALLTLGFDFLLHSVGLVSLGGALFFGCGMYAAGALNYYYGLPPVITLPLGAVIGALVSTVLLLPCLRLRGIYFAMVSLAYPLMIHRVIEATLILGGTEGLIGLDGFPNIWVELYLIIGVTLAALFGLRRLYHTDFGLVLRAIKDNDQAVRASGINITTYKAIATFITALLGSFAGAYVAHLYRWAGISGWALDWSIFPIAAAVIGGMGTLSGAVVGSFILVPLSEMLRAFGTLRIAFYSLALVAFIIVWREGLMNWLERKYHQIERWVEV